MNINTYLLEGQNYALKLFKTEYRKMAIKDLLQLSNDLEKLDFEDIKIDGIPCKDYFGVISFEYFKYIKQHEPEYTKLEYILYLLNLIYDKIYDLKFYKELILYKGDV